MSGTETIQPISEKPHPVGNGVQKLYRFDNGSGASVVQLTLFGGFGGSYDAESGLWEMAVVRWTGEGESSDYTIDYDTGITDDVIGHLARIRDLPSAS